MEIMSLQVNNPRLAIPCKARSRKKAHCNINIVSCKVNNNLALQRGKSNFYQVLSLGSETVGLDEIKKAYRRMALQYHPDVCPSSAKEESTKRFVELQKAYETLSDPISRKIYDYEMGLSDSLGSFRVEERRSTNFPKEVWEKQLCGLKQRSRIRMERKKI